MLLYTSEEDIKTTLRKIIILTEHLIKILEGLPISEQVENAIQEYWKIIANAQKIYEKRYGCRF